MKVKVLRAFATTGKNYAPGEVVNIDDAAAKGFINAGFIEKEKITRPKPKRKTVKKGA